LKDFHSSEIFLLRQQGLLEGLPFSRRNVQLQGEYPALQPMKISFNILDTDPESGSEDPLTSKSIRIKSESETPAPCV
jgi:hypothetical protein